MEEIEDEGRGTSPAVGQENENKKKKLEPATNGYNKVRITESNTNTEAQNNVNNYEKVTMSTNKFKAGYIGPYYLFIEGVDQNIGKVHPMSLGKMFYNSELKNKDKIINIRSIGANRLKVETKTYQAANEIVSLDFIKQKNWRVYIPTFLIQKMGVIKNIDTQLSEKEIMEVIRTVAARL